MSFKHLSLLTLLSIYLITSCNYTPPSSSQSWQFFAGRDNGQTLDRPQIYRALVPSHWIRHDTSSEESLVDTTKSICEFTIQDNDQSIRLTIHTFPILQDRMRIPPIAQITRWKGQFEELDLIATHTLPDAHGGFNGLFFEGEGILNGKEAKVMGWSMQLAPIFERHLNQGRSPLDQSKRADYTIKASGPLHSMNKHRQEIIAFANSFELIDELPAPP